MRQAAEAEERVRAAQGFRASRWGPHSRRPRHAGRLPRWADGARTAAVPGLDRHGQGACLVNNLAFRMGTALVAADLTGLHASGLEPRDVGVLARIAEETEDRKPLALVA